jgi:hypothetical protein
VADAPLDKLEAWKRHGALLRKQFEDELAFLETRASEIRTALKGLPVGAEPRAGRERSPDSISSLIRNAVGKAPGASSGDVVKAVLSARPDVKARVVHAILYRLRLDKEIRVEGERGGMRYFLEAANDNQPLVQAKPKRRSGLSPKSSAREFFGRHAGRHPVAEVAKAIGLEGNHAQARNVMVRLCKEGVIRRVSDGVYERSEPRPGGAEANTNP